jgi:hypothetical protein
LKRKACGTVLTMKGKKRGGGSDSSKSSDSRRPLVFRNGKTRSG